MRCLNPLVCRYEVFRGLSLPLVVETKSGKTSWLGGNNKATSIQDCLAAFTADEVRTRPCTRAQKHLNGVGLMALES